MQLAVIVIVVCFLRLDSYVVADTIDRDGQFIVWLRSLNLGLEILVVSCLKNGCCGF
jgi:hypothetical protein